MLLEPKLQADASCFAYAAVIEDSGGVVAFALQPLIYLLRVDPLTDSVRKPIASRFVAVRRLHQSSGLFADPRPAQRVFDGLRVAAVKDRRNRPEAHAPRRPAEVRLQHLTDVHAAGHADRVEDDVHGCAIFEVRHVLCRQDSGDHPFVPVPPRHLVALRDLAALSNRDADDRLDARREIIDHFRVGRPAAMVPGLAVGGSGRLVVLFRAKTCLDHLSAFPVGHP